MPDLKFRIEKAEPEKFAAAPTMDFALRVDNAAADPIHAVVLRCQIRIEPTRRTYQPQEKTRLRDLFGEPSRWGQTVRSMLWTHAGVTLPAFTNEVSVPIPIACTQDFNLAATKYFFGLDDGTIPLCFLFSGTIFHEAESGGMQVCQIPWEKQADFALPVSTWRAMMDLHYPNLAWLTLRKDAFDALHNFKIRHGLPTWEAAVEKLLAAQKEDVTA